MKQIASSQVPTEMKGKKELFMNNNSNILLWLIRFYCNYGKHIEMFGNSPTNSQKYDGNVRKMKKKMKSGKQGKRDVNINCWK